MEPKEISSQWTFFYKFMYPILLVLSAGEFVAGMAATKLYGFIAVSIVLFAYHAWKSVQAKRVRHDGELLYVSNYIKEIVIPFKDMSHVAENTPLYGYSLLTIHLKTTSAFGNKIRFMPKFTMLYVRPHPVATELRTMAGLEETSPRTAAPPRDAASRQ